MIEIKKIVKSYGKFVLDIEGIEINEGESLLILGPNGSGKTTFLNLLATIIKPDYCNVKIFGKDLIKDYKEIRKIMGYVMHDFNLYENLTVYENLKIFIKMYSLESIDKLKIIEYLYNKKFKELSYGQKKLVSLIKELIKCPRVLLLDEAFSGLDVKTKEIVMNLLKEFLERKGIAMITTHNVYDAKRFGGKYLLLDNGKKLYFGDDFSFIEKMMSSRQAEA